MNILFAAHQKACSESMHSENSDPNLEGPLRESRVQHLVKVFENMKLLSETQKIEIKGTPKAFNKKYNSKDDVLAQENPKPNGCVERLAIAGIDQPLAKREQGILSGNSCDRSDRLCNMTKYEDCGSSDVSDAQSLHSTAASESSSKACKRLNGCVENPRPNGCVERLALAGTDQPLDKREQSILSGKNCDSFDHHCNMNKYEDCGSSDVSDTQRLHSTAASESSSKACKRPNGCVENPRPNGYVGKLAIAGTDQPLDKREQDILAGKNCDSFDHHCNMKKYENCGSSDVSDTQSLHSTAASERSSGSRRRSKKSFGSIERVSPTWKNRAEQRNKQVRATAKRPFRLLTEQRGEMKVQQSMKNMQQRMNEEGKHRIPIAQGLPSTIGEPQVLPKPPVKDNTKPLNVKLHTESRAVQRAKFDHLMEEKLKYLERQRLEEQRLWKVAEEEEIQRLRKEMVPYAQLMPYFDRPFIPKKSSKTPTTPRAPKFHSNHCHTKCPAHQQVTA